MKRSKQNLSHSHTTSFDGGQLIPIACEEVLAGDSFTGQTTALVRVTPQAKPIMHRVQIRIHHFYVPNRIVWDGWEDFQTGVSATPPPTISGNAYAEGYLADYFGVLEDVSNDLNALPFRCYNKIWNEYYRDKDLQSEVAEDNELVQRCAWAKDYFTSARPSPQRS